jgi:hypothetical protein
MMIGWGRASGGETFQRFLPHTPSSNARASPLPWSPASVMCGPCRSVAPRSVRPWSGLLAPPGRGGFAGDGLGLFFLGTGSSERTGDEMMILVGWASWGETFKRFLPHTPSSNALTCGRG